MLIYALKNVEVPRVNKSNNIIISKREKLKASWCLFTSLANKTRIAAMEKEKIIRSRTNPDWLPKLPAGLPGRRVTPVSAVP